MKVRLTTARQSILEELQKAQAHLTAREIHDSLQTRLPSLNLSTVYRNLVYLVEHRLISVSDMGVGSPVYELIGGDIHHHLVCQQCHQVINLGHDQVAPFFEDLAKQHGFEVHTNHLVLYGFCRECGDKRGE